LFVTDHDLAKLREEPQVVVEEQAQVVHAVTQHGQAFNAHAEGKALELFRIDPGHAQHVGVNHAAAHHFQPARLFADAAAFTAAHHALHINFGGWLGEREERRTETHRQLLLEEHTQEFFDGAFEVGEIDVAINQQAFDLMEHRRVGDIRVATVHTAWADDADRRLVRFHGADLYRRGMGAQQHVRVEIEGVVHRPGRVMAWDVERLEVVIVVFDLRAFGDAVADMGEELLDTLQSPGDRMQTARGLATTRQGYVNGLGGELGRKIGLLERRLTRIENLCDTLLRS